MRRGGILSGTEELDEALEACRRRVESDAGTTSTKACGNVEAAKSAGAVKGKTFPRSPSGSTRSATSSPKTSSSSSRKTPSKQGPQAASLRTEIWPTLSLARHRRTVSHENMVPKSQIRRPRPRPQSLEDIPARSNRSSRRHPRALQRNATALPQPPIPTGRDIRRNIKNYTPNSRPSFRKHLLLLQSASARTSGTSSSPWTVRLHARLLITAASWARSSPALVRRNARRAFNQEDLSTHRALLRPRRLLFRRAAQRLGRLLESHVLLRRFMHTPLKTLYIIIGDLHDTAPTPNAS